MDFFFRRYEIKIYILFALLIKNIAEIAIKLRTAATVDFTLKMLPENGKHFCLIKSKGDKYKWQKVYSTQASS